MIDFPLVIDNQNPGWLRSQDLRESVRAEPGHLGFTLDRNLVTRRRI